ncbi:MAG: AAA family ATPase [Planctomycetota bacterium]
MPVRIDALELAEVLSHTPPDQNVMLVGRHGIGKSEIVRDHYTAAGLTVVPFFLGQMSDPGDLIGLMHKNEETGRSEFLPPAWWPEPDRPVALFLDELNRARPEVLQSVMELALNKTLVGRQLPKGSVIVSAVNSGDEYQLTDLDPALVSRFNLYEFVPTVDDWLVWAAEHSIDQRVIDFITDQPHWLDGAADDQAATNAAYGSDLNKTPDRRGWARVARMITSVDDPAEIHIKMIAGIVGTSAANAFRKSLRALIPVSATEVLLDFNKHRKVIANLSVQQLTMLNDHLVRWPDGSRKPAELKKACTGLKSYITLMQKQKLNEVVAHLVSLLEKPRSSAAMGMVAGDIELTKMITDYMSEISIG